MSFSIENFVKNLEDTGILADDTLKTFIPPNGSPKDADELALQLIQMQKLTKFQVEELFKGNSKSLVLGNYILLEKIGAGGMGQVFKAQHRRMKRTVALKTLPSESMKDPSTVARFEREVEAVAKISHPNIVAAHDAGFANGVHFLVMELIDGCDLSVLIKKNGPIPIEKAIDFTLQAARGLESAHKKGIVHRDIKPANLLLSSDGVIKILDLGLARLETGGEIQEQSGLTNTGMVMGTVDYMSPEQASDTKTVDGRADIYSLGCTLYFLLTGKAPYDGKTLMARLLAHRDEPIPSIRKFRPEVTEQMEMVFKKMVAKTTSDRYQSIKEVIIDLQKLATENQTISLNNEFSTMSTQVFDNSIDFPTQTVENETPNQSNTKLVQPKNFKGNSGHNYTNFILIGAAFLGFFILGGIIVSLKTKDGTLVVEIDQPDALVQVLDSQGKVEISQKGTKGTVSISVDPGKHRLKIEKDGFIAFAQDFETKAGDKTAIKAKLVPLEEKDATGRKPLLNTPDQPKETLAYLKPGFEEWVKAVREMPAQLQLDAVSKKLMELNPGFDGKITVDEGKFKNADGIVEGTIENGVVKGIQMVGDHVKDLSPVRAFSGLKFLNCSGSSNGNHAKLTDLSPLNGMKINNLLIYQSSVNDLTPLKGMPLNILHVSQTFVKDLSPLKGMPLKQLIMTTTPIDDLSPISGMKLTYLALGGPFFSNLSSLKGMPLEALILINTSVEDLSPLQGIPLGGLNLEGSKVKDLSPIKNMPLKWIKLDLKPEYDYQILRSMKNLEGINDKPVTQFWIDFDKKK